MKKGNRSLSVLAVLVLSRERLARGLPPWRGFGRFRDERNFIKRYLFDRDGNRKECLPVLMEK